MHVHILRLQVEAQDKWDAVIMRLGTIVCSWMPCSTSAGMWVEGSLLGTTSRITWIAYTDCKNAGGTMLAAPYRCDGGETKYVRQMGTLSACMDGGRPVPRWTTEQRLFHMLSAEVLGVANTSLRWQRGSMHMQMACKTHWQHRRHRCYQRWWWWGASREL